MKRALLLLLLAGCDSKNTGWFGTGGGGPGGSGGSEDDLTYCVEETNRYRATIGRPPYTRSADLERSANDAARVDGSAHEAHLHFQQTNGDGASAENEIPWWSLSQHGSVRDVVREGIAAFWSGGPGEGHYEAMASSQFTAIGCGIYVSGDEVTVVQNFR